MKRSLSLLALALLSFTTAIAQTPRPSITGIAYVRFYSTDIPGSRAFYGQTLGFARSEQNGHDIYAVGRHQHIEIESTAPLPDGSSYEIEVGIETSDPNAMRQYLRQHGVIVTKPEPDGFSVLDPDGHRVAFVPRTTRPASAEGAHAVSHRIIHAGFTVTNRAAEEHFYGDILGFHPYWHGGPNGTTAYASMQVPEGTDWVEFMLGRSASATKKQLGGANHVALGVIDINAAASALKQNRWKDTTTTPKQGQDGKWQLNLFDPDDTRAELMEFTPTRPPCCSEYKGKHPSPNDP